MVKFVGAVCGLVGALALSGAAQAAIVAYNFSGFVITTSPVYPSILIGSPFHGSFAYDSDAPINSIGLGPPAEQRESDVAVLSFSLDFGAFADSYGGVGENITGVSDSSAPPGVPSYDRFFINAFNPPEAAGPAIALRLTLVDHTNSAFSSAALPSSLDLSRFDSAIADLDDEEGTRVRGMLTSLTRVSAVPEPATWAMMIAGFGLLGGALRRQRRPALA